VLVLAAGEWAILRLAHVADFLACRSARPLLSVDFRTGTSTLGSGEFEVELASVPPGDGGVGGQVRSAEDG